MTTTEVASIGKTILHQLPSMVRASIGARDYVLLEDGVQFRIGSGRVFMKAIIRLNVFDTYDVEIVKINRKTYDAKVVAEAHNIYNDQLGEVLIRLLDKATN